MRESALQGLHVAEAQLEEGFPDVELGKVVARNVAMATAHVYAQLDTADAIREQTKAIAEQTKVLKELARLERRK